jgi:hypothetical protein
MPITQNQRNAKRYPLSCPIEFEGGAGRSRDISTTGIYFLTASQLQRDEMVILTIYSQYSPAIHCEGRVVRSVPAGEEYGIAVSFTDFFFEQQLLFSPKNHILQYHSTGELSHD